MTVRVIHGDCLVEMAKMDANSIDAICCDPPYGLEFMGKEWDHGVPGVPFWDAALAVAKPGAHLLAFGGTRTFHRLTCAIEDAGWEIRDCLMWLYGSGFPKSHNGPWGGTALKPAWEPIILARKPLVGTVAANVAAHGTGALNIDGCRIVTEDNLNGGAYSGGVRPMSAMGLTGEAGGKSSVLEAGTPRLEPSDFVPPLGRWPANLVLDEDAAAILDEQSGYATDGVAVNRHRTERKESPVNYAPAKANGPDVGYGGGGGASRFFYCSKAPSSERWGILTCDCQAARLGAWENEDQNPRGLTAATSTPRDTSEATSEGDFASCTSSSGSEPTDPCPKDSESTTSTRTSRTTASKTSDSSAPPSTSASTEDVNSGTARGGSPAASAENSSPSRAAGISRLKAGRSTGDVGPAISLRSSPPSVCGRCGKPFRVESHPTQKPVALMRWLVRLVAPPGGLVCDPFAGSGTTGIACALEGFGFVGIESEAEYVAIARRRIAEAQAQGVLL